MREFNLIDLMIRNSSHAMIIGTSGVGKTTLIKEALCTLRPTDYNIVVLDTIGSFCNQTTVHGPLPLNVFEFCNDPVRVLDCLNEALLTKFRNLKYCLSPAMEENFLEVYDRLVQDGQRPSFRKIMHVLREEENTSIREKKLAVQALIRRLRYFDTWMLNETHPVVRKVLRREVRGLTLGIDLSFLSDVQRFAYVLLLLLSMSEAKTRNIVVVVDEAHLLLREETTVLGEQIRIGRNFGRLFLLITHSPEDIPSAIRNIVRIVVRFPLGVDDDLEYAIENPHAALVKVLITDDEMYRTYSRKIVTFVAMPNIDKLRDFNITNLRKCLNKVIREIAGQDYRRREILFRSCLETLRREGFFPVVDGDVTRLLRKVWQCLDYG